VLGLLLVGLLSLVAGRVSNASGRSGSLTLDRAGMQVAMEVVDDGGSGCSIAPSMSSKVATEPGSATSAARGATMERAAAT
jgi:hypothetical protein